MDAFRSRNVEAAVRALPTTTLPRHWWYHCRSRIILFLSTNFGRQFLAEQFGYELFINYRAWNWTISNGQLGLCFGSGILEVFILCTYRRRVTERYYCQRYH